MTTCIPSYGNGPVRLEHPAAEKLQPLRVPLQRAARQNRKMLARIKRAIDAGNVQKAKGLQRTLLASFSARVAAVAEINPRLKSAEMARSNEVVAIAERISAFRPTDEEVKVVAADKPSGGWRPFTIFGLERAALQKLACWAIRPFHTADPRQYALTGGGHTGAARFIEQALADGYSWFVGLDITNFYSSIERSKLHELIPLPRRVIDVVIDPAAITSFRVGHVGRALAGIRLVQASQSGISQGSRSSPLTAEIIVKDILRQLPLDGRIVNVADDFGIVARSKRDAVAIQLALTRASARSPVGCFQLRSKVHSRARRVYDGFEFLGYHFRKRSTIQCFPSDRNIKKFMSRVSLYGQAMECGATNVIPKLRRYLKQWWGSFPLVSMEIRDPSLIFVRYQAERALLHQRRYLAPLVDIAVAWDEGDFAMLPPAAELAELSRAIRRANPKHRSKVPHW